MYRIFLLELLVDIVKHLDTEAQKLFSISVEMLWLMHSDLLKQGVFFEYDAQQIYDLTYNIPCGPSKVAKLRFEDDCIIIDNTEKFLVDYQWRCEKPCVNSVAEKVYSSWKDIAG